jgi:hypothetical protein
MGKREFKRLVKLALAAEGHTTPRGTALPFPRKWDWGTCNWVIKRIMPRFACVNTNDPEGCLRTFAFLWQDETGKHHITDTDKWAHDPVEAMMVPPFFAALHEILGEV